MGVLWVSRREGLALEGQVLRGWALKVRHSEARLHPAVTSQLRCVQSGAFSDLNRVIAKLGLDWALNLTDFAVKAGGVELGHHLAAPERTEVAAVAAGWAG